MGYIGLIYFGHAYSTHFFVPKQPITLLSYCIYSFVHAPQHIWCPSIYHHCSGSVRQHTYGYNHRPWHPRRKVCLWLKSFSEQCPKTPHSMCFLERKRRQIAETLLTFAFLFPRFPKKVLQTALTCWHFPALQYFDHLQCLRLGFQWDVLDKGFQVLPACNTTYWNVHVYLSLPIPRFCDTWEDRNKGQ